jgi:hypothetical protein
LDGVRSLHSLKISELPGFYQVESTELTS